MPNKVRQSVATLPDRIRLPKHFDPARLQADLDCLLTDQWIDHLVQQNYDGKWTVLPLRQVIGATHPVMTIYADPTATEFEDAPALARVPYLREILAWFGCPLQTARLMRLGPGSVIREHRDHDLSAALGMARIHIPIVTNDEVEFLLNGHRIVMVPGSVWYLRLADRHSVANRGVRDRVHLVIDCVVNDWLETMLVEAGQTMQPSSVSPGSTGYPVISTPAAASHA